MPATKTKTPTLTIPQRALNEAITAVMPAISSKPNQPILTNLKIDINKGAIRFTAFDGSMAIKSAVDFDADIPSQSFCIPAKYAADIVGTLRGELDLSIEESCLLIKSGKSKYKIPRQSSDDYPALINDDAIQAFSLTGESFRNLLSLKALSSEDESKQVLCGVCLSFAGHTAQSQATDGHRLGAFDVNLPYPVDSSTSFVLPSKVAAECLKLCRDESSIEIFIHPHDAVISIDDTCTIQSRLLVGHYPNVLQLITLAGQSPNTATLDRRLLLDALKRISVVAEQHSKDKLTRFEFSNKECIITADGINHDEGLEAVECNYSGDSLVISFKAHYMIAVLGLIQCNRVSIRMDKAVSPTLFTGDSDDSLRCVIAPVGVRG